MVAKGMDTIRSLRYDLFGVGVALLNKWRSQVVEVNFEVVYAQDAT